MGYFKKERYKEKHSGDLFDIYHPTVYKKDTVYIKDAHDVFVKPLKRRKELL